MMSNDQIPVDNYNKYQNSPLFSLPNNVRLQASDSANMPDLLPSLSRVTIVTLLTRWNSTIAGFCLGEFQTSEAKNEIY